jgi:hypothetical protein
MPRFVYEVRYLGLGPKKQLQVWEGEATSVDVLMDENGEPSLFFIFDGGVPVFSVQQALFESGRVTRWLVKDDGTSDLAKARQPKATLAKSKPL